MSFLSGKKSTTKPDYTGLQIQTSVNTLPVPVIYGRTKTAPNIIWQNNFRSKAQKAGGGKGGGGTVTGYSYSVSMILALCEGPIGGVPNVWVNTNDPVSLSSLGFTLYDGTSTQAPWGYVTTNYSSQALAYQGTAYICAANYGLGSSPDVPNHNMEIIGILAGTAPNGIDADPALMINDWFTNEQYGVWGFPAGAVDQTTLLSTSAATTPGDNTYQTYCNALGIGLSPCMDSTETASSILTRWAQLTNTALVWSASVLRFIPYGDTSITGNGVTYLPNTTPIYDLDDDDWIYKKGEPPVTVTRSDPLDAKNTVRLECWDRSNSYTATPIDAHDQNSIELYGMRIDNITAHEICDCVNIAPLVGQLILQRDCYIRNQYNFTLGWEYGRLEAMDLVTLTRAALGLNKTAVRIIKVKEDDNGNLAFTAEEYPAGVATATLYAKATGGGSGINTGVAPGSVNPPVIFEPASSLTTGGDSEVWIAASGGPYWGGCEVWISADGANYENIGTINGGTRQGVLTSALPIGSDPDTTNTLAIDLTMSEGSLIAGATTDADAARTLLYVDNELISYSAATLTSAYNYSLGTYLRRGQYNSTIAAHPIGGQVARLDGTVFKYPLAAAYVGNNIWVKLQSFNLYQACLEDISTVTAYEYLVTGNGSYIAPPTSPVITTDVVTMGDGSRQTSVTLAWIASPGPNLDHYVAAFEVTGSGVWTQVTVGASATSATFMLGVAETSYSAQVQAVSSAGYPSAWEIATPVTSPATGPFVGGSASAVTSNTVSTTSFSGSVSGTTTAPKVIQTGPSITQDLGGRVTFIGIAGNFSTTSSTSYADAIVSVYIELDGVPIFYFRESDSTNGLYNCIAAITESGSHTLSTGIALSSSSGAQTVSGTWTSPSISILDSIA
jgi:hypothetical protein